MANIYADMYPSMLLRVQDGMAQAWEYEQNVLTEIGRAQAINKDLGDLSRARKAVHLQILCLKDQEKRLQEAIASL